MSKRGISFTDVFEARVKFNIEKIKRDLHATLEIRKNKLPLLSFDSFSSEHHDWLAFTNTDKHELKCKSEIKDYTLFDCDVVGEFVYPRFIVEGYIDNHINGVEIALSGFSAWFDQYTHFKITDSEVKKYIPDKHFSEKVFINGTLFGVLFSHFKGTMGRP